MSKYGTRPWRRVLALTLVFLMTLSTLGSSGYTVFAEDVISSAAEATAKPETDHSEEVVEPSQETAESTTPEAVDNQLQAPPEEPAADVDQTTEQETSNAPEQGADVVVSEDGESKSDGEPVEASGDATTEGESGTDAELVEAGDEENAGENTDEPTDLVEGETLVDKAAHDAAGESTQVPEDGDQMTVVERLTDAEVVEGTIEGEKTPEGELVEGADGEGEGEVLIDPETGLPIEKETDSELVDGETDPELVEGTEVIEPQIDPETGFPIDPETGLPIDPETGLPVEEVVEEVPLEWSSDPLYTSVKEIYAKQFEGLMKLVGFFMNLFFGGQPIKTNVGISGEVPVGTDVVATAVSADELPEEIADNAILAYDITLPNEDIEGGAYQPADYDNIVTVEISNPIIQNALDEGRSIEVYHIDDEGNATKVSGVTVSGDTISFDADSFSVYAIVASSEDARLLVKFVGLNNAEIASMYVKQGDNMEQVLYDPGAGTLDEGVYFRGWTTVADYTPETTALSIEGVRTAVSAMLPPETDGTVVTYYAMLFKDHRITYLDENDISLGQEEVTFRADSSSAEQSYKVNMAYTVQNETFHFEGWNVSEGGSNIVGHTDGTKYTNNQVITITGDVVFSVYAPKGHWFIFDENGKGATYNAPQFVYSAETPDRPNDANMIRNGYTFGGWYSSKEIADNLTSTEEQYDFEQTLSDKVTVYARWIPKTTANYTIIIWKQNISGDGYDFVEPSITGSGAVGQNINAVTTQGNGVRINGTNYSYTGFHLKEYDQDITITTEGNAVVNVYFDRNQHTLTFKDGDGSITFVRSNGNNQTNTIGDQITNSINDYENNKKTISGYEISRRSSWGPYTYAIKINGNWYAIGGNRPDRIWDARSISSVSDGIVKTITALYGQSIGSNFPIVGSNGVTYTAARWDPQSSTPYNEVLSYIDIMPDADVTFHKDNGGPGSNKTIYYYVEALPGETGTTVTYGNENKRFILYKELQCDYNWFTEAEDYIEITGFDKYGYTPSNAWGQGGASTVYCYYTRKVFAINFMDGKYVDGDNNPITETGMGQIGTKTGIAYCADVSSNNSYEPDADHTPSGYVFEGWYLDDACTQKYTFDEMPEGGITVYAKWRQKQYRVFLHVNYPEGATGNINWGTANQAMTFRVSEGGHVSEPTGRDLAGFAFDGWYLDPGCTQVFNGDAYVINEKNVTTPYDKTVDMTDTYDNNGFLTDPKKNSDLTGWDDDGDNTTPGKERFWITTKLDIYAKWHSTLDGASGIVIEYDANGGTGAPTDTHTYVDTAKAPAGAASKAPTGSNKVFGYWEVQKWENGEWVGTGTTVLPGDTFTVLKANAKVEDLSSPAPNGDTKKYTVRLKAVYIDSEAPTPTHISWFKNDGTAAYVTDENAVINVGVDIHEAPTRAGYTFLGWARVATSESEDYETAGTQAAAWEANNANWTQNLTASDLYLHYAEDGKYHLSSTTGTVVTQVAPDENLPYHAMFAVWVENEVTINYAVAEDSEGMGTVSPVSETIKAASGTAVGSTATASSDMYIIDYWTCDDGTEHVGDEATFVPSKNADGIYEAHTYYAHFKLNQAEYTIHHYLLGTTTAVADDNTGSAVIGSAIAVSNTGVVTIGSGDDAITIDPAITYQEKNLTYNSYDPAQPVTIQVNGNVITIYYTLPLTITVADKTVSYTGSEQTGYGTSLEDNVTVEGLLTEDSISAFNYTPAKGTDVGEYTGAFSSDPTVTNGTDPVSYYVITPTAGKLIIGEKTVTITAKDASQTYNGSALTQSGFTVTGLEAGDTHNFTVVMTEDSTITNIGTQPNVIATVDGTAVTAGTQTKVGNYTVTVVNGTLTVDPKKVTITANDASQIYNGKALTESDFTASALESGDTHEFAVVMTEASTITNVGTQPNVIATVDGVAVTTGTETAVGNYLVTTANGTLTVNPKAVTITAKDANKPYDGDPLIQPEFTATDLEAGDDHQFTVVMTEASTITDVGTKPNVIATVDGVSVTTGTATAVGNYTVTTADGTLTITQDEVALTITSATKSWTYDSTLHKEEVYAVTYNGEEVAAGEDGKTFALENGDVVTITATAEGVTNVSDNATNNNTYTYTITRGTTDTSGNYKSVVANVGTLTINPKAVTITAKDDEKAYDGNPLVQPGFTASELEEGDTHTFNVAMTADSTITNPGTKPNVIATVDGISVTTGTATAVGNYTVTTANGTLKITEDKKPIIIKSADGEWTYDGEDHTKYEYTVTYGGEQLASDNGRAFTLSNGDILTITPAENAKVKHVSDSGEENNLYSYVIKRGDTVTTNYYTSKTATYGDLSITTRSVTMTSATDTKEYDGLPLTNSNVAVTGDGNG